MKLNPFVSALVIAAGMTAPTVLFGAAADLNSCCTPADKDMPKVGGNLGNQSYSSLAQINKSNINMLGPVWKTSTSAQAVTQPVAGAGQRRHRPADDADRGRRRHLSRHARPAASSPSTARPARSSGSGTPSTATGAPFGTTGTRRGVSVGDGKVYTLAAGNRVVALNKDTGAVVWAVQPTGAAPVARLGNIAKVGTVYHDGMVFVGTNDGNRNAGVRGEVQRRQLDRLVVLRRLPSRAGWSPTSTV